MSHIVWQVLLGVRVSFVEASCSELLVLLSGSFNKCLYFSLTTAVSKLLCCVMGEQIQLQFVNKFNQWYGHRGKSTFP